ncbi:hypothetical protein KM043_012585 [Ampulex compressa]|nr:hypothetical protein KM043_012585 [Ampulex compressa]
MQPRTKDEEQAEGFPDECERRSAVCDHGAIFSSRKSSIEAPEDAKKGRGAFSPLPRDRRESDATLGGPASAWWKPRKRAGERAGRMEERTARLSARRPDYPTSLLSRAFFSDATPNDEWLPVRQNFTVATTSSSSSHSA